MLLDVEGHELPDLIDTVERVPNIRCGRGEEVNQEGGVTVQWRTTACSTDKRRRIAVAASAARRYTGSVMTHHPEVFVLGGPNGAGKTTVAAALLPRKLQVDRFINADFIAKGLSPHAPETSAMEAGRSMLRRIRTLRDHGETFAFESTLASRSFVGFLRGCQRAGYIVHVIYVALESADLAVQRVKLRVERGGHDIPEAVVRRRYERSVNNLLQLYLPLADGWSVWDNSGDSFVSVAHRGENGEPSVVDPPRWRRLTKRGARNED